MNLSERDLRDALERLRNEHPRIMPCPPEEALVAYAEGYLPASDKESLEAHLAACEVCLDAVLLQRELPEEEQMDERIKEPLGESLGRLARALLSRLDLCDLAVRWVSDALDVVQGATNVRWQYAIAQTAVRSGATAGRQRVQFTKTMGPFTLEVELAHDDDGYTVVMCGSGSSDAGVDCRVNLYSGDRELESVPVGDAPLTFDGLAPGYYQWVVEEGGKALGGLNLNLGDEKDDG
jgi:hypothetical protein